MTRSPQRPGLHGGARRRAPSEFGQQLMEKQKIKAVYGLREAQMSRLFKKAAKSKSVTGQMIFNLLERRLDNVVYRLGLAPSRSVARQLVSHGHVLVGGRKVTVPSYSVQDKKVIAVRPQSREHPVIKAAQESLKQYGPPAWLAMDRDKLEGVVLSQPKDFETPFDVNMVVDYYSKIQ